MSAGSPADEAACPADRAFQVTVGSMVVMALLFLSEFMYFRAVHVSERLTVDDRLQNETVHFRVTIGFPSLKCDCACQARLRPRCGGPMRRAPRPWLTFSASHGMQC